MYKIFINDKPLILAESADRGGAELVLRYSEKFDIDTAIAELEHYPCVYLTHTNLEELWELFRTGYDFVEAAGGVVSNPRDKWLVIHRLDRWDLPKGKVEKGENVAETAIREVKEECGLKNVQISYKMEPTYHTYVVGESKILKETTWFAMTSEDTDLSPQKEEGIEEVRWVEKPEFIQLMNSSYASIQQLVKQMEI